MCIDWDRGEEEPYTTYGKENLPNFRGIEVIATPCNYIKEDFYGLNDQIPDICDTDPEKQFEYLGSAFYLNVLHNSLRLDFSEYGEKLLVKESTIFESQF